MSALSTLHLLIGPVGAGKSTFARQQIARHPALHLDVDTAMVRLFGDDPRPSQGVMTWYLERRERCRGLLWDLALDTLRCGVDVYLELGLVRRAEREQYFGRARLEELRFIGHVLDAPREVRRQRVVARNELPGEYVQKVPLEFFERASDAWEPVLEDERARWTMLDE